MEHKDIEKGQIHVIHNIEFADITERDAYIPSAEDLKKVCLVNSPFSYYALKSINPTAWEGLSAGVTNNPVTQSEITKSNTNPSINRNPSELGELWVNYTTNEIFMCTDNTTNLNIWKGNKNTIIAPKTVYKFDIFGDNSAVSFLQLDDDLTDMGGTYTITTANTVFETGKMEKCLKSNNDSARLDISGAIKSISFWAFFPSSVTTYGYFFDCRSYGDSAYCYMNSNVSPSEINQATIYENKSQITTGVQFKKGEWVHIAINLNNNPNGIRLLNHYSPPSYGITNIKIDHVRCFNRALTNTDLEKLFAEA